MKRRHVNRALAAGAAGIAWPALAAAPRAAGPGGGGGKVLRYAFSVAETGFDPAQVSDLYSRIITSHIFDTPLTYDHLARPFKLKPLVCEAMPEVSDDFRTFVFRIRPGIFFADDPAFRGRRRELVAEDFVYAIKRIYDPRTKSPLHSSIEDERIAGLQELREAALKGGRFDYDRPVEGLRAVDRFTLRVHLRESRPRHLYTWASRDIYGAVAREVVEHYGAAISAHPVGTGPFRLAEWRRSSKVVLVRNEGYREHLYDAEPNADDAAGRALVERFRGRRLPMIDRVEISIIEQAQPRWLSFLNGEQNFLERIPNEFVEQAIPGGTLAPNLVKRGVQKFSVPASDITLTCFNLEDPLVGGYTPEKVALRRAMSLGTDIEREIRIAFRGLAVPAQSIVPPNCEGYRPERRTESSTYDLPRARALLDTYGWVDRNGDGWRETPDGKPFTLVMSTQSDGLSRIRDELWKKDMDALQLRGTLKVAQWPENLKSVRAGAYQLWRVGSLANTPDGQGALERGYGPSTGKGNLARFKLPAFDALYEKIKLLPNGPERMATFDRATSLMTAYTPYRISLHRIFVDLAFPEVVGYVRPTFWIDWWQYVDIDPAAGKAVA
jgi:ABC-type transport system substrate-binding protein